MNPATVFSLWNFEHELKYVITAMLTLLMLPVIAVILLTQVGINIVSDKLVDQNPTTQTIDIKDPATGTVITQINPTVVWPSKGKNTLEFGQSSPFQVFHTGLDIAGKIDEPINPAMDGTIIYAGEIFWGYGKHIIIDHGNHVTTIYAHLNKINVYKGQPVTTNDIIGTQGHTGWATGIHLHFQVNVFGIPVNPRIFLGLNQ